jgi:hypothetical protein
VILFGVDFFVWRVWTFVGVDREYSHMMVGGDGFGFLLAWARPGLDPGLGPARLPPGLPGQLAGPAHGRARQVIYVFAY